MSDKIRDLIREAEAATRHANSLEAAGRTEEAALQRRLACRYLTEALAETPVEFVGPAPLDAG
jgi:hypothetical protein